MITVSMEKALAIVKYAKEHLTVKKIVLIEANDNLWKVQVIRNRQDITAMILTIIQEQDNE